MKNIERAKKWQKTLYLFAGKEWSDKDFTDDWIYRLYGADWDFWYEKNLAPQKFCALCGEDNINIDHDFVTNVNSKYGVRIHICESCAKLKGYDVSQKHSFRKRNGQDKFCIWKHLFTLFGTILFWYVFFLSKKGVIHLVPIICVNISNWFNAWLSSVSVNEWTFFALSPLIVSKHSKIIPKIVYGLWILLIFGIIFGFYLSRTIGIVSSIAAIWSFFAFPFYWLQIQRKRNVIGS